MTLDISINGERTSAMIDSGASANFLSKVYAQDWALVLDRKERPYPLVTADGSAIESDQGMVKYETTVSMEALGKVQKRTFDVTNIGDTDVILGLPWLQETQPRVDWSTLTLSPNKERHPVQTESHLREQTNYPQRRGRRNVEVIAVYLLQDGEKPAFQIPKEYKEFRELFQEEAPEDALPPHQPWDHEIVLKEGTCEGLVSSAPVRSILEDSLGSLKDSFPT
jgi:hypothetical protein